MTKHFFWILLSFLILWLVYDNHRVVTTRYDIEAGTNLKIGHISDIHYSDLFPKAAEKLRKEKPDIIVVTGDVLDFDITESVREMLILSNIAPTYFVSGNHDVASPFYEAFLEKISPDVTVLNDSNVTVNGVTLYGMDELSDKAERLTENYSILLTHHPEKADSSFDLTLCGHTHGGQVRIPLIGGMYAPGQGYLPKYSGGLYDFENSKLIVNRGVGGPRPRINNPSEVVVVQLH